MQEGYTSGMDRPTIDYLAGREHEKWTGFIVRAKTEYRTSVQADMDKILGSGDHTPSQNGANLRSITEGQTEDILYFAGQYNKKTKDLIVSYLRNNNLPFKQVDDSYEFFTTPYWVKRALGLPPKSLH